MIDSGVRSRQQHHLSWTRERLLHERAIALGQAINVSTWKNYGSALNSYLTFVCIHNLPVEPTADSISFFTVFMCHHIKPNSVNTYLLGIFQQLKPYYPSVREIRKSIICKRARGTPTNQKRALTLHNLQVVIDYYAISTSHDDLLSLSLLLTGFFTLMRLGKLTIPYDKSLFDHRKITS